jgi:arylsulfatase A-like enzyme
MPERIDFLHAGAQEAAPGQFRAFLEKKPKDKPFVFQVGFSDPHMPWTAADFEAKYRPEEIRLPGLLPDTPEMRKMMVKYYADVSHADMLFGEVMAVLEKSGQSENTMVVFMGDNGASIPFGKGTLYQMGWKVPLLVRWPGHAKAGTVSDELISGVDLFATFLEAGGVRVPARTESRSFLNVLNGMGRRRLRQRAQRMQPGRDARPANRGGAPFSITSIVSAIGSSSGASSVAASTASRWPPYSSIPATPPPIGMRARRSGTS